MKRSKMMTLLLTGALSVSMLAAGAVTSFAAYNSANDTTAAETDTIFADNGAAPTIPVNKVLKSNLGTTVNATFEYEVKAFEEGVNLPAVTIDDIVINKDSNKANAKGSSTMTLPDASTFEKPGTYVYEITEKQGDVHFVAGEADDAMSYDDNAYKMRVFIYTDENGALAYKGITVENKENGKKVGTEVVINEDGNSFDGVTFVNKYWKDGGSVEDPDPTPDENPDTDSFRLTKKITGEGRTPSDKFVFTVTFTLPSVLPTDYTGPKVDKEGTVEEKDGKYVATVTLGDDETATFDNVIAGTTYKVSEADVNGNVGTYTATYKVNGAGENETAPDGELITENANTLVVTNKADDITITGLALQAAPYAALIGLGIALMAAYVFMRRRAENL